MESSITKALENAQKHTTSTPVATVNDTVPMIPADPTKLPAYINVAENLKSIAIAMQNKPNISKEEYEYWDIRAKEIALAALDAALKLSISIKEIPSQQGQRTDIELTDNQEISRIRTKKEILEQDYGLSEKKANRISKLTVMAADVEKKRAMTEDEPVSISRAITFEEKKAESRATGQKNAAIFAKRQADKQAIPKGQCDIIYTDIENALLNVDDIAKNISDIAIMFVLTEPSEMLRVFECFERSGFEYRTNAICERMKTLPGGKYVATNHIHLVIGTRGEYPKPENRGIPSVCRETEVGDPATYFPKLIKEIYPAGAMLDLIAENKGE